MLEDFFPTILRQPFFVATYSLVEGELDERCRSMQKSKELLLSLRKQYLPSHQQYLCLANDEISLREGFCEEVVETIRVFFRGLDKV
jgi:hypothetical protein